MYDVVAALSEPARDAYSRGDLANIIYVDNILLFVSSDSLMQEFLGKIADVGQQYGMEFHWNKF